MHEVTPLFGAEERDYWLNQLDILALLKIRRINNFETSSEFNNLTTQPGDGLVQTLFRLTLHDLIFPYGAVFGYSDDDHEDTIARIEFYFREDLTETELKILAPIKKKFEDILDDISGFDFDASWEIEQEDILHIKYYYFVGVGLGAINFMNLLKEIKPYLTEGGNGNVSQDRASS
ncbi:putative tryptophanyl-tRNA synthetase [Paenibacillus sp. TCA20]|uniref:Uncharacterized protein n=1 Tax=Paenibacillus urinalis TaxID=521520 RepID=A0ABY7XHX0_9BACL|nr:MULTISPECIES: hypothetical protein [Paenibacillus]WDI05203.1 hypothetical protein PUW25_25685 [Paenibacillus urinalis]GAK41968.1 putative tryptophanyl-tRNA synthetase [Paenibacillus sp. TCA20]